MPKIAVTSPSFSRNKELTDRLHSYFPNAHIKLNKSGQRLKEDQLVDYIGNCEGIILGVEKVDKELLSKCKHIQVIAKYGVGLDNIDLEECKRNGIKIGWQGGLNKLSVAEMVLGFMIGLSRNLYQTAIQLKNGTWNKSGGWQLTGKTIGIIGVGNIGKEVIRLLKPFNVKILVNDIVDQEIFYEENDLIFAEKDLLLKTADIVSVHTPLNEEMKYFFTKERFQMMKSTSFLINTARGPIVKEQDLKWALSNKVIKGAAVDVFEVEPPLDTEFLALPNLFCTPHIGGNAREAVLALGNSAIDKLKDLLNYE